MSKNGKCSVCGKQVTGIGSDRLKKGMCSRHYQQFKRLGKCLDNCTERLPVEKELKECSICGIKTYRLIKGMCNKHYLQFKKHGHVLDTEKEYIQSRKGKYDKHLIGDKYTNNKGQEFEIIGYCENSSKRMIRFTDSGYETETYVNKKGLEKVKDWLSPTICDVGIVGDPKLCKHPLYYRWLSMIHRCYLKNYVGYENYGALGVVVSDEWKDLRNYIKDMESKDNYDKLLNEGWELDKDLSGKKIYSNETTVIISPYDNSMERIHRAGTTRDKTPILQFDLNNNFIEEYDSITEASKITGISLSNIASVANENSNRKTAGGFIWIKKQ